MMKNMKQNSRKKTANIILIALLCIIIFFMIFSVCLIHNANSQRIKSNYIIIKTFDKQEVIYSAIYCTWLNNLLKSIYK